MQKLREIIENHTRWLALNELIERIEAYRDADFSTALENAKSLIESIGKEICKECCQPLAQNSSMNGVLKKTFTALGYSNENTVNQISRSLAKIGEEIGNLRNDTGITGHGRTMDEIRKRNSKVDEFTKSFLFDSIRTIAIFLIQVFEDRCTLQIPSQQNDIRDPEYQDYEEFNEYLDGIFAEFKIGEYSFFASEILYHLDNKTYHDERRRFEIADDMEDM